MYSKETVRKVKRKLSIGEVLNRFCRDRQENFQRFEGEEKISCFNPNHEDEHPSCNVNFDKDIWHCFSCEGEGDLIDAVSILEGVKKLEAISRLAEEFDIEIPNEREGIVDMDADKEVYRTALKYFQENLEENHIEWLKEKYGLSEEIIDKAKLGFADGNLFSELRKEFEDSRLYEAGFLSDKYNALPFENRIMVSYFEDDEPVFFTGRIVEGADIKYLNLKNTEAPLYKPQISGKEKLIITEGGFDALAAVEAIGDRADCVALGTAGLSENNKNHLSKLVKRYEEVVIINDNDEAGKKGALETAQVILEESREIAKIGQLKGEKGEDIADYCKKNKDLKEAIEKAKDYTDLLISNISELESGKKAIEEAKNVANKLGKGLSREYRNFYADEIKEAVAEVTGSKRSFNKSDIVDVMNKAKAKMDKINEDKFIPSEVAEEILDREEEKDSYWSYIPEQGVFYHYGADKGYWSEKNKKYLRAKVREVIKSVNKEWESKRKVTEVVEALKESYLSSEEDEKLFDPGVNPKKDLINVENGMLDWEKEELKEHSNEYYSLFQFPIEYDKTAKCPN